MSEQLDNSTHRGGSTTEADDTCCAPAAAGTTPDTVTGPNRRSVLSRRVRLLVAATITYNVLGSGHPDPVRVAHGTLA